MNMKTMKEIAADVGAWYPTTTKLATKLFGCQNRQTTEFLAAQNVPYFLRGKTRIYFLPDVIEAIEAQRWKTKDMK